MCPNRSASLGFTKLLPAAVLVFTQASCLQQETIKLLVQVKKPDGSPAAQVDVVVQNQKVGTTDGAGRWHGDVSTQKHLKMWTTVIDPNFTSALVARAQEFETVRPFYDNVVELSFELVPIQSKQKPIVEATEPTDIGYQFAPSSRVQEDNLEPLPDAVPNMADIATNKALEAIGQPQTEPSTTSKTSPDNSETIVTKRPFFEDKLSFKVTSNQKPIEKAQLFLGRNTPRTMVYLGSTDAEGKLESQLPKELQGETLFIRHSCCVPLSRQLAAGSGAQQIQVELVPGVGHDFIAATYSYGLSRGIENAQLFGVDATTSVQIDHAGPLGLLLANGKIIKKDYRIQVSDALTPTVVIKNLSSTTPEKPTLAYFVPKALSKPTIAMFEIDKTQSDDSNAAIEGLNSSGWKRFKRDFQSRFLTTAVFRPILSTESDALARRTQVSLADASTRGWDFTPLKEQIDLAMTFTMQPSSPRLTAQLIDRTGHVYKSWSYDKDDLDAPERTSSKLFTDLLTNIPFEGHVSETRDGQIVLNFGSRAGRNLRTGQWFVLYTATNPQFEAPVKAIGVAVVNQVDIENTILDVVAKTENVVRGALAIRVTESNARNLFPNAKFDLATKSTTSKNSP